MSAPTDKKEKAPELPKYKREFKTEDTLQVFNPDALPTLHLGTVLTHIASQEDYAILAIIYPHFPGIGTEITGVEMLRLKTETIFRRDALQIAKQWKDGVFVRSMIPPISGPVRIILSNECKLELITKHTARLIKEPPPKFAEWLKQKMNNEQRDTTTQTIDSAKPN